jgi:rare lipoprotein A
MNLYTPKNTCILIALSVLVLILSLQGTGAQDARIFDSQTGLACYYGKSFHGQKTASGEIFNKYEMVAAHPTYRMGSRVRVTNLKNDQSVEVRIVDRGPAQTKKSKRYIIDVSEAAAKKLGFIKSGKAKVKLEVLEWGGAATRANQAPVQPSAQAPTPDQKRDLEIRKEGKS